MDRAELIRRLMETFLLELQEHVRVFNAELLALERQPSAAEAAESIKSLFRAVHSMKGAARSVDAHRLAKVCHELEEILAQLRDGRRQLSPELFAVLFEAADAFEATGAEMAVVGSGASPPALNAVATRIAALREGTSISLEQVPPRRSLPSPGAPAAAPPMAADPLAPPPPPPQPQAPAPPPPSPLTAAEAPAEITPSMPTGAARPSSAGLPAGVARSTAQPPADARASLPPRAAERDLPLAAANVPAPLAEPLPEAASRLAPPPRVPASITEAAHSSQPLRRTPANDSGASAWRSMAPPSNAEERAVVRVPVRRLDALLAQSGELSVARRRFETRREEIVALSETVTHLRGSFRAFGERSRRISLVSSGNGGAVASERRQPVGASERLLQTTAEALEHIEADLSRLSGAITEDLRNLERAAAPLERQVHRVRMLAFGEACEGLQRAVRDLANAQQKEVDFTIEGAEIELDRAIIEGARSALLHLVRNAIDHGIESPAARVRAGKPGRASLIVRAAVRGERVEVSVSDDGRGLDLAAVAASARKRGLAIPDDERELRWLIFQPGFSTASTITDVSGRGVGLDVVRSQVESARGEVDVSFERGRGTCFVLKLPITTSTLRALLVSVSDQLFAIPNSSVRTLVRASSEQIGHVEGREMLLGAGGPTPLCSLRSVLGVTGNDPARTDGKLPVVVLEADGRAIGLSVDGWIAEQDLVLKQLGRRVKRVRHVSAAAMLPSGQLALLLKTHELVRSALALAPVRTLAQQLEPQQAASAKRVLLVDDSVTTRTLERSILEASGYEVIPAADGAQAFKLLQEKGADIVVSDVEMPRMDGFMLTEAIRGSKRFRELPVVLLTALGSEEDRARGLACGADAYLVKSAFDQDELLDILRQLL